jgi:hypothetical protein
MKWVLCLIVLMASVANAQQIYLEGNIKSIYASTNLLFERGDTSIDFSKTFDGTKILSELSLSSFISDSIAITYTGLYRTAGTIDKRLIGKFLIGGEEIKDPTSLNSSVIYNSLQFEWFYQIPFIRPVVRVEQVRINIGLGGKGFDVGESYNAVLGGIGVQGTQFFDRGSFTGQATYLAGGGANGYDVEADFKYYFPRLSTYLGVGYKTKYVQIDSIRFDVKGPYFEIGVIF